MKKNTLKLVDKLLSSNCHPFERHMKVAVHRSVGAQGLVQELQLAGGHVSCELKLVLIAIVVSLFWGASIGLLLNETSYYMPENALV